VAAAWFELPGDGVIEKYNIPIKYLFPEVGLI